MRKASVGMRRLRIKPGATLTIRISATLIKRRKPHFGGGSRPNDDLHTPAKFSPEA
jgi:hypothetical protein